MAAIDLLLSTPGLASLLTSLTIAAVARLQVHPRGVCSRAVKVAVRRGAVGAVAHAGVGSPGWR